MVLAFDRVTSFDVLSREIAAFGSGRRLDNEADAWAVLQEPEVVVLRWPIEQAAVSAAREQGRPRFLVVEGDDDPPHHWDDLEEWVRLPADRRDVQARVAALRSRSADLRVRPSLDGYDRLFFRGRWVALTPSDYKLVEPLVERFDDVVPYERVVGSPDASDAPRPVAGRVRLTRLRRRIAPLGLQIRTVRPHGLALSAMETALA
jgi:DNA-binding response OmpR family regulator